MTIDLDEYKGWPKQKIIDSLIARGVPSDAAESMARACVGPPGFYDERVMRGEHGQILAINGKPVSA